MIEMHGRFAPHQAVEIAKAIEKYNPAWIEEPCRPDDLEALEYVKNQTSIPIATGEIVSLQNNLIQFSIKGLLILSNLISISAVEYLK